MNADIEDAEPTGRTMAIRSAGDRGDVRELARVIEDLVRSDVERRRDEKKAALLWRTLGGAGVTVAIALGSWGLAIGQTTAVDHQRLDALSEDVRDHRSMTGHPGSLAMVSEARRDAASTAATLVEVSVALRDLRTEVRDLRGEITGRRQR